MDFRFGAEGQILSGEGMRYRDVGGAGVLTPWFVQFDDYADVDGVRVPLEGGVEWILPEGRLGYWHGRIQNLRTSRSASVV